MLAEVAIEMWAYKKRRNATGDSWEVYTALLVFWTIVYVCSEEPKIPSLSGENSCSSFFPHFCMSVCVCVCARSSLLYTSLRQLLTFKTFFCFLTTWLSAKPYNLGCSSQCQRRKLSVNAAGLLLYFVLKCNVLWGNMCSARVMYQQMRGLFVVLNQVPFGVRQEKSCVISLLCPFCL